MDLEVVKTTPVIEPMAQLNIGANFTVDEPAGRQGLRPRRRARPDHRQGDMGGRLPRAAAGEPALDRRQPAVRARRARHLHAYDAATGKELWSHNDGLGHNGGIISYSAKGKQYVDRRGRLGVARRRRLSRAVRRALQEHADGPGLPRHLHAALAAARTGRGGGSAPAPSSRGWRARLLISAGAVVASRCRSCVALALAGRRPARRTGCTPTRTWQLLRHRLRLVPRGRRPQGGARARSSWAPKQRRLHHQPDRHRQARATCRPSGSMLDARQIQAIIHYIRNLKPEGASG